MKPKCKRREHLIRPDAKELQRQAAGVVHGRVILHPTRAVGEG